MIPKHHRRFSRGPAISILVMLMGFAVFGWGLHYKLSLYEAPTASSAREPAAKLLSNQERASVQANSSLDAPTAPHRLALIFAAVLFLMCSPACNLLQTMNRPRAFSRERRLLGSLFRRPPPSLLFSV